MAGMTVGPGATSADGIATPEGGPAVISTDLDLRMLRLEHLVSGLGLVLGRLEGRNAVGTTVFDDFEDPVASREALIVLLASSADARLDLKALQRDLAGDRFGRSGPGNMVIDRVARLGTSATELATSYVVFRRSMASSLPPRSPAAVQRLDEIVSLVVGTLRGIAELAQVQRTDVGWVGNVPAAPPALPTRIPPPEPRNATVGLGATGALRDFAAPVADGLWSIVRRRRSRLAIEFGGVLVVALLILISALGNQGRDGLTGNGPRATDNPGLAFGGGSPIGQPSPGASPGVGPSQDAGETKSPREPLTPRATPPSEPAIEPGTKPALAANRFKDRIVEAAGAIDRLLDDVRAAARESDMTSVAESAAAIARIAASERAWLQANPAARCYELSHQAAVASYGELLTAATAIEDDATAGRSNAINQDIGGTNGDISALRRAGTKAVSGCA